MTVSKHFAKRLSFYLILIAIPFIILLTIEFALRLFSFGDQYPLFINRTIVTSQSVEYLQPNEKVINRYFSNENLAPNVSPDTVYFKKEKPQNSFRIFIQGGSTAAGFPYGRWGSLQGMLEQRFKRLYPNKEIEIINTAMAAVNSYTLLDFVDEIIEQQPDLVLIYAGHNEYLGIMGVGSAFAAKGGRLTTLLHLALKEWRLYQLLQKFHTLIYAIDIQPTTENKSLMSQVAKEKEIVFGSDLYKQGIEQFQGNMSQILSKYQTAGIPVMLGSLVSNENGQIPFSSVGKVDWHTYESNLNKNNALLEIAQLNDMLAQNKSAINYYKLALNLQFLTRYKEAKEAFVLAKDYDLLRFRAPSQFSVLLQNMAKEYNASWVDVQGLFNHNSTHGIIGNQLILEHLHPTVDGYFLLAEAYANLIVKQDLIKSSRIDVSRKQARLDIPVSAIDKLYGDFVISKLVNDFPFTSATNIPKKSIVLPASRPFEKQALIKRIEMNDWLQIQKDLLVKYQQRNEIPEAAKIAGAISTAMVDNHQASYIAGQLYQQLKDWPLARYYHSKAVSQAALTTQEKVQYLLALAQDYFFLANYSASLSELTKANDLMSDESPQKQKILRYIINVKQAIQQTTKSGT
jgi:lysophospholipase L1-like esterase